ncbi:MAG: hypothetical protein O3C40_30540 [Planctomycetota bacterium]|nr:hypothetical protein [Planctomycetota bacterium]
MSFSIYEFDALTAERLQNYMEALLARDDLVVTPDQFSQLFAGLGHYDHYHLVYALNLCARYDVNAIALLLPNMLSHTEGAVFCAALNILQGIPAKFVTSELLRRIEAVVVDSRFRPIVKSLYAQLKERSLTNG